MRLFLVFDDDKLFGVGKIENEILAEGVPFVQLVVLAGVVHIHQIFVIHGDGAGLLIGFGEHGDQIVPQSLVLGLHVFQTHRFQIINDQPEEFRRFQGQVIHGKILGSDVTSTEVGFEVNLKNRFFPVIELGYSDINTTDDETNIHYKATAPYFRLGLNYNVFYKKPHLPGYFTVGLRYGFSSFSYDVQAPDLTDPNWGGISVPVAYEGVKTNTSWAELVLGLRTQVYKSFYMGFTVRYRSQLSLKKSLHSEPYYIPGFGKNKSSNFGFTYNLIYRLPF